MSAHIAGIAWVTPLGADLDTVWQRLAKGDAPHAQLLTNPETGRVHGYLPVPPKLVEHLARHPRMRRSSAISFYAVAAGLAALENAGLSPETTRAGRTAVVLAVSDGSVVYTRRFYDQLVKQGANAASPLLFPETVYNAPASHLAALIGIDGASYTLVGDNSVGLAALHFANQLLALGDVDRVLVVGAEEIDWVLCEAYRDWRLARTPLAEGAAAVVLAREGRWKLRTHAGMSFSRQREAAA
jgi:3-oxoacyl-(acyl-carrier-protein) synthase